MRSLVVCSAVTLLGCVSFPHARLDVTAGIREELQAPVVCGPMGFRKTPLQSRWGEYVRVTVRAPSTLRGAAFVNANGKTGETRRWSTAQGELVVEARFENLDPDQRYLLQREQPIDITLTGLEGACEGAVFTVEQGELVPDIDEPAWLAELERRGGPELAARREAARLAADARRQAHYAAWEARQELEVSAEVVLAQNALREAHYAQWEAQRHPDPSTWAGFPTVVAHSSADVTVLASGAAGSLHPDATCSTLGAVPVVALHAENVVVVAGASGCVACATGGAPANVLVVAGSGGCATCAINVDAAVSGSSEVDTAVIAGSSECATCAVDGAAQNVGTAVVAGSSGCATCAVDGAAQNVGTVVVAGSSGCATCAVGGPVDPVVVAGASGSANVETVVEGGAELMSGCATCASGATEWALPEQGRLREVTVTTEQHAVASAPAEWAPAPVTASVEIEEEEVVTPGVEFVLPALFNFMLQATAPAVVGPAPRPAQRVVRAVPVNSR